MISSETGMFSRYDASAIFCRDSCMSRALSRRQQGIVIWPG